MRLGKRERQARRARVRAVMPRDTVLANLSRPMPELSSLRSSLRPKVQLTSYRVPRGVNLEGQGTKVRKEQSRATVQPVAGMAGYRLTKRSHREVIARFAWQDKI